MNILITGGAGFIGSHLCDRFLNLRHRVVCVDNMLTGSPKNLDSARETGGEFIFINANVNRRSEIEGVFKSYNIDAVYHYAAVVGVRRTQERPFSVLEDIDGIKNIMDLSLRHNVKKIIYASSSEVYGEPVEIPTHEKSCINPSLTYAAVKLIGERFCRAYYEKYGLRTCSLRFFNVYGPRQNASPYGFVVGILIKRALAGEDIAIYGDGSQTRDFTFIADVVNSSEKALFAKACDGEVINIGTGVRTSILSLARAIIEVTGSKANIRFTPKRLNDVLNRCAEINKMSRVLGYAPEFNLSRGLDESVQWYRTCGHSYFKNERTH
ncbi:MAG: SDR family NAD(P)-dependent oxidoreductase [Candidatus Omnitrophica bacterium]|nr:SDR family NAD(P)-dependent oxidoreductase [Candidatus Omnitrophota bacterium]